MTAKDYIQDGLIAMWDGIENAGWGVHDVSAITWKDLMGGANQDFTLTEHGSWGLNHLQMDGVGAAATCDKIFPYSEILTVECVVRLPVAVAGTTMFNLSPGHLMGAYYYLTRTLSWGTNASGAGYTMSGTRSINGVTRVCYVAQPGGDLAFSGRYANGGPVCTQ